MRGEQTEPSRLRPHSCHSHVRVYLHEHVIDDEKQVYDLGSHDEDKETPSGLVETDTLQLAVELKRP